MNIEHSADDEHVVRGAITGRVLVRKMKALFGNGLDWRGEQRFLIRPESGSFVAGLSFLGFSNRASSFFSPCEDGSKQREGKLG